MLEPTSDAEVAAFERWIAADAAHAQAYREIERVAVAGERLPRHLLAERPAPRLSTWSRPAFAAAAAIVLLVAGGLWFATGGGTPSASAAISNPGPAVRGVRLPDHTVVILDARSDIALARPMTSRLIDLTSGRARFAVAGAQSPPVTIAARGTTIIAASATIDVAISGGVVTIAVIAGSVKVRPGDTVGDDADHLRQGQAGRVVGGTMTRSSVSPSDMRWPDSRLNFAETALSAVVAKANRQGTPRIILADPTIGPLRVTGILDIRDTRALARKLAAALALNVSEDSRGILLSR